ncbi:hypothetical protein Hamer_G017906, partial [Homarus americanus]
MEANVMLSMFHECKRISSGHRERWWGGHSEKSTPISDHSLRCKHGRSRVTVNSAFPSSSPSVSSSLCFPQRPSCSSFSSSSSSSPLCFPYRPSSSVTSSSPLCYPHAPLPPSPPPPVVFSLPPLLLHPPPSPPLCYPHRPSSSPLCYPHRPSSSPLCYPHRPSSSLLLIRPSSSSCWPKTLTNSVEAELNSRELAPGRSTHCSLTRHGTPPTNLIGKIHAYPGKRSADWMFPFHRDATFCSSYFCDSLTLPWFTVEGLSYSRHITAGTRQQRYITA